MERRGQERANSNISYANPPPPQIAAIQESPVKLPLAPILSTPPERRGTISMVSTRRGSSIFSPTQTLDHHHNHFIPPPPPPQHHHQQQPSPPPPPVLQQPLINEDSSPDPDPPPTSTPALATASNSNNLAPPPAPPSPPAPPLPQQPAGSARYRECLKNHAANMGGHVVDGCGEFMPSGDDGTPESLRCAACDCHRNFHRKETEGHPPPPPHTHHHTYVTPNSVNNNNNNNNSSNNHRGQLFPSSAPPPHHHHHHNLKRSHSYSPAFGGGPTPPTMVNFGGNSGGGAAAESSSEDLNMFNSSGGGGHAAASAPPSYSGSKKRFRTKFSQNQKNQMHEFASKLGWKMQKQDEKEVQQFCNEVGVKRQVFKVWMHNNKQAIKKTQSSD